MDDLGGCGAHGIVVADEQQGGAAQRGEPRRERIRVQAREATRDLRHRRGVAGDFARRAGSEDGPAQSVDAALLGGLGDLAVPAHGALAHLARRAEQHQTGDAFGRQQRGGHRHDASHRVADEHRPLDRQSIEHRDHVPSEVLAAIGSRRRRRASVPSLIEKRDRAERREARRQGVPDRERIGETVQANEVGRRCSAPLDLQGVAPQFDSHQRGASTPAA